MSQELSTLAAMMPLSKNPGDDDQERKNFVKQHIGFIKKTYLNPERKEVRRWQPPPPRAPLSEDAKTDIVSQGLSSHSIDAKPTQPEMSELQHFDYDTVGFFFEESENDDDDSAEDIFTPGGISSSKRARNQKKSRSRTKHDKARKTKGGGKDHLTSLQSMQARPLRNVRRPSQIVAEDGRPGYGALTPVLLPKSRQSDEFSDKDEIGFDTNEAYVATHVEDLTALADDEEDESSFDEGDEDCLRFRWEVINRTPPEGEESIVTQEGQDGQENRQQPTTHRNVIIIRRTPLMV